MIGVTLVAAVSVLGASMKDSIFGAIDDRLCTDAIVAAGIMTNQGIPDAVVTDIEALPEVEGTMSSQWAPLSVNGRGGSYDQNGAVSAVMGEDPSIGLNLDTVAGDIAAVPTTPGCGMSRVLADDLELTVGDPVTVTSPLNPDTRQVPLLAIWEDDEAYTPVAVSPITARELVPEQTWFRQQLWVTFVDGADSQAGIDKVIEVTNPYAVFQVMDRDEFRQAGGAQVDSLLAVVYALLALSVIIAFLGIINTLALSITERRREFGMLRAVGMQRGQIRRMITVEPVVIAVIGAVSGVVVGGALGAALTHMLADDGLSRLLIPWSDLVLLLVGAMIVGVLAAIIPARNAARTHPLAAVH
ncbi:ABC transporter permease [Corynebacterium cystitidis]|uniref:ABC transporter permease n=1 Tax=Corynebacterium cystitidis TaxID=35757 RepID=UPI00211E02D3|nr:ABC transporter permease [Corynebacterium cystitidis]